MKFQKIEIENFASYYGKVGPIQMETAPEKPLVVFIGRTGFGKTSFFDAINWALYGPEYEKDLEDKKGRNILDYVNESALREAANQGQRVQMSVTLFFEHDGSEYYITQTVLVKPVKEKRGNMKAERIERHTITHLREIKHSGDHEAINYSKIFLDEILPNNVKSYFLFDGDRIHNLAKPGNSQEIQDAIYRVVDLEIIRNAGEHLNEAANEYSKKAAKTATGELATIEEEHNNELDFQNKLKARLAEIKKERQAIKDQVDRIEEKLIDLQETKALQERKNHINKDLQRIEGLQKELKSRMRENAAKASLGLALKPLQELRNLLHEKRSKGEIPKHIREIFFKDLFDMQQCICGTTFQKKEGDPIYENLKKLLEVEKTRSQEEDHLIDLYHQLNQTEAIINEAKKQLEADDDQIMDLEEEEKKYVLERQEIDNQLSELPAEDINKLVNDRKKREEKDKEIIAESTSKQDQLVKSEEKLKELDKQIKELGKKQEEVGSLHLRSELAKNAAQTLEALYEKFAEESRKSVEELTIQEFKNFVLSSSGYKVGLSKDYELEVLDSNDNRALQRLSMGQSQCLSLAFITAISRVSEKYPPLVIDMPFSRLDHTIHDAVSKRLPKLSQQIILFLIPEVEWNQTTKSNLTRYASYIYEMHFDENVRESTITRIS